MTHCAPLVRSDAAGIATLTLSNPAGRNPLSEALLDALSSELAAIAGGSYRRTHELTGHMEIGPHSPFSALWPNERNFSNQK